MRRLIWGFMLLLAAAPASADPDDNPPPAEQVKSLMADFQKSQQEYAAALRSAKTDDERIKAQEKRPNPEAVAGRLLELAEQNPNDAGVNPAALIHVITLAQQGPEASKLGQVALERLTRDHAASDQLEPVVLRLSRRPTSAGAALLRAVADKNPKDDLKGKATYGLAEMYHQAADLGRRMQAQPDFGKLVESALGKETAEWLRDADADRMDKDAEELYETAADKFADVKLYGEETLGDVAKGALFEIRHLGIGKTAPEIEGEDLDGTAFKLSDYRGKVVVIDFWGNW